MEKKMLEACKEAHYFWAKSMTEENFPEVLPEDDLRLLGIVPWIKAWELAQKPEQLILNNHVSYLIKMSQHIIDHQKETEVINWDQWRSDICFLKEALKPFQNLGGE